VVFAESPVTRETAVEPKIVVCSSRPASTMSVVGNQLQSVVLLERDNHSEVMVAWTYPQMEEALEAVLLKVRLRLAEDGWHVFHRIAG
jgi:hypothetical protein